MSLNNIIKVKRSDRKYLVCLKKVAALCFFWLSVSVSAGSLSNLTQPFPDSNSITRNEYSYNIDMEVPDNLVCLFVDKYNELKKSKQLLA